MVCWEATGALRSEVVVQLVWVVVPLVWVERLADERVSAMEEGAEGGYGKSHASRYA